MYCSGFPVVRSFNVLHNTSKIKLGADTIDGLRQACCLLKVFSPTILYNFFFKL